MLIRVFWGLLERLVYGVTECWLHALLELRRPRVGSIDMCTEYWISEASGDLPLAGGVLGLGSALDVLIWRRKPPVI